MSIRSLTMLSVLPFLAGSSCLKSGNEAPSVNPVSAAPDYCGGAIPTTPVAGSTASAHAFAVDPMVASGNPVISPASGSLGNHVRSVTLSHLTGRGILEGAYVDVVNGLCGEGYGVKDNGNEFYYAPADPRFAEVMTYRYGDALRSELDHSNSLLPVAPLRMIANCSIQDNAYYSQRLSAQGTIEDFICMGTSSRYAGANFSHDGHVVVHEAQHAATGHAYSPTVDLNRLEYDEAGALNEGVSDFVALVIAEPETSASFDVRTFSRWALGSFFAKSGARGAHRCPVYDADFPNCASFATGAAGFSADANRVSFAYPDGLGWPYARTFAAPGYLRNTFLGSTGQQEIHQTAPIVTGVLWEIYEALKANHGGNATVARRQTLELLMEALAHLPKPTTANVSPVTFPAFGAELNSAAQTLGFSGADRSAVENATDARGLTNAPQLPANWAAIGSGSSANAGLRFIDLAPASGIRNERFNAGDQGAVWLDIENLSALTAGGILVDVTVVGTGIRFLGPNYNYGYLSDSRAVVRYGKVNGSAIVSALASTDPAYHVPTGPTYFRTDPNYDVYGSTALWVEVLANATPRTITLRATLRPANGPAVTLDFPAEIR